MRVSVFRGVPRVFLLTVTNESDGLPANLDTEIESLEFRVAKYEGAALEIGLSLGSGIQKLAQSGATLGQAEITVSAENNDIDPGVYVFDVVATATGGDPRVIIRPSRYHVVPSVGGN